MPYLGDRWEERGEERMIIFLSTGSTAFEFLGTLTTKLKITSIQTFQFSVEQCPGSWIHLSSYYASWLAPEPGLQSITLKFTVFCCHEMCYRRRCRIIFRTLPVSDNLHSDSDLTPELFPSQGFSCEFKRFSFYLNKYWKKPWCNLIIMFPVRYL